MHFQFVKKDHMHDSRLFGSLFIVGGDSLQGQLMNFRAPETAIYEFMQQREVVRAYRIHPQSPVVAVAKLAWTAR